MSHTTRNLIAGSLGATLLALGAFAVVEMATTKPSLAASAPHASVAVAAGRHVEGNHFVIDGAPAAECAVGASCVVAVKLVAQAEFHINQQYPYKFTAVPAAGVTYLGADAANPHIFTKTAGDLTINDEKTATMNIKFKAAQKGAVTIGGTFKLSVCSSANCQLEQQDVSVDVTVK